MNFRSVTPHCGDILEMASKRQGQGLSVVGFSPAQKLQPVTLLMTATIQPPAGMPGATRSDPTLRRDEYLAAFRNYLALSDDYIKQIVVLENSDSDLSDFAKLARNSTKTIHLINTSSDYPAGKGKGYGEFLMTDQGLTALGRTGAIDARTKIWKVTGRLIVRNLPKMLRFAPGEYDLYCDLRQVPFIGESLGGNDWMELRLFSFTPKAYDALIRGRYDVHSVVEKGFFKIVKSALDASMPLNIHPRFKVQPVLDGFNGLKNTSYRSLPYRAKNGLRSTTRVFMPFLWL